MRHALGPRAARRRADVDPAVAASVVAIVDTAARAAACFELASTVRHASPLLLDALAARGVTLGSVRERLDPLSVRTPSLRTVDPARMILRYYRHSAQSAAWHASEPSAPLTLAPRESLHLVRAGPRLGLRGWAGRLRMATIDATAWLGIDDRLPETLALALPGRHVDALMDHPLLTGRRYVVLAVEPGALGTVIRIRTGMRRCRTPWTAREALDAGADELGSLLRGIAT